MMTLTRLSELLDAYGADPDRWPLEDRVAALELMARSAEARTLARRAGALDTMLDAAPLAMPSRASAEALAARIVDQVAAPNVITLSRTSKASWGWPNWTALAAAAVAGLVVGWSGLNIGTGYAAGSDLPDPLAPAALEEALW
jgi:hypothetical protein